MNSVTILSSKFWYTSNGVYKRCLYYSGRNEYTWVPLNTDNGYGWLNFSYSRAFLTTMYYSQVKDIVSNSFTYLVFSVYICYSNATYFTPDLKDSVHAQQTLWLVRHLVIKIWHIQIRATCIWRGSETPYQCLVNKQGSIHPYSTMFRCISQTCSASSPNGYLS